MTFIEIESHLEAVMKLTDTEHIDKQIWIEYLANMYVDEETVWQTTEIITIEETQVRQYRGRKSNKKA